MLFYKTNNVFVLSYWDTVVISGFEYMVSKSNENYLLFEQCILHETKVYFSKKKEIGKGVVIIENRR